MNEKQKGKLEDNWVETGKKDEKRKRRKKKNIDERKGYLNTRWRNGSERKF